jgi:hypothetical protein
MFSSALTTVHPSYADSQAVTETWVQALQDVAGLADEDTAAEDDAVSAALAELERSEEETWAKPYVAMDMDDSADAFGEESREYDLASATPTEGLEGEGFIAEVYEPEIIYDQVPRRKRQGQQAPATVLDRSQDKSDTG